MNEMVVFRYLLNFSEPFIYICLYIYKLTTHTSINHVKKPKFLVECTKQLISIKLNLNQFLSVYKVEHN